MIKGLRTSVAVVLIASSWLACSSQDECAKKFGAQNLSLVAACQQGADQVSTAITHANHDQLPDAAASDGLCEKECRKVYNLDSVPVANDPHYFDDIGGITDQVNTCKTGCVAALEYKRQMAFYDQNNEGCMEVRGPGGITRCDMPYGD